MAVWTVLLNPITPSTGFLYMLVELRGEYIATQPLRYEYTAIITYKQKGRDLLLNGFPFSSQDKWE